jgi:SMI1/KNR4 family protein SUKH-1
MTNEGEAPLFVASIRRLEGATVGRPALAADVERLETTLGARLPGPHRALLLRANGVTAGWGYDRILGVRGARLAIESWNDHETWKFAWPRPLDDYLCFAETAWGDEYAYRLRDLRRGVSAVHRLDHILMERSDRPVAADFEVFLRDYFRAAETPRADVLDARAKAGDLAADEHVVVSPSPLRLGSSLPTSLSRMPARAAMIMNGDLATQLLDPKNQGRDIASLEHYQDERDRPRVRVVWG